ncbi:phytase-like protein with esterase activity [Paenibacillus cellulosilyticus]|uniref:Phytase-like protein with esterase activity n=1 Tax=Paenibacillus cellulosilyticus TaxID=375489 RepID=A0A2V2YSJ5_9BACL|nr:esterase-like activity of phytase family protein [Paenibacillus cellulosilyticus]PWV98557.1 phytase-like protein with esterase activity [Paenibacillus cellulosilyticus]QKS44162.1 esterase-like activity of phytase family protein [Paenibacillus cellulosilyticus]
MKKKWVITTATGLFLTAGIGFASAAVINGTPALGFKFSNNGQAVSISETPVNIDGHLYVPVRALSEAAGKYVDYDAFSQGVALTDKPTLIGKYALKDPNLAEGIKMGVGSSLTHLPGDPDNVFYTTADRGPNGQIEVNGKTVRTFPLADYTPTIYKIEIADGTINIIDQFPLKVDGVDPVTNKANITGLPNIKGRDEAPYDAKGETELAYDPYGLDIEGLAYNAQDDTFWISDEYGPSIAHVKRDGTLIERIVPQGWASQVETPLVPARETLPAVYNKLRQNRGAEAVGITQDGKYMFMAMQNALRNPDKTMDNSRQVRIIKFDLSTLKPIAEFVYQLEDASQFKDLVQGDIVVSDLVVVNDHTLLIDERDKFSGDKAQLKRIYAVDLTNATNVLGKYDDDKAAGKTLEQMTVADLKANSIKPVSKRTVLDSVEFKFPYEKIEGVTLTNGDTLTIVNDNDFGVDSTTEENGTELWQFKLPYTLK